MKLKSLFIVLSIAIAAGCNQEPTLTVSPSNIQMYYEGTCQLKAESSEMVSYQSMNTYHALVDENGLVTGGKVGQTEIKVSAAGKEVSVPVEIEPRYILYPDMTQYIDQPLSTITAAFGTKYGKKQKDGKTLYTYSDVTTYAPVVIFSIKDNVCTNIYVYVSTSYVTQLTKYLIERYLFLKTLNDVYYLADETASTLILYAVMNVSILGVGYNSVKEAKDGTKSNMDANEIKMMEDLENNAEFVSFTEKNDGLPCPRIKMP